MKRTFVTLIAALFGATAASQTGTVATDAVSSTADANRAKQEIVKSTTQSQTKQMSGAGYHGPKPASEARRLSDAERQQVMQGVARSAKDQYRPAWPAPDKNAPKVAKPDLSDPAMREQLVNAKH